ncbi:class I SAM-dependent methyltransferase [Thermopolyspora sp. NPDC052614]|uniref:class I SAM-dependent methyltransferase n=1 Tax=Thermopolyspora sp. NPDC052614 TaxID=3155682 RepID=UPI0034346066
MDRAERWRRDLDAWAIPDEIIAAAPENPWGHLVSRFGRRTDTALAQPAGPTLDRARESMPAANARFPGSVLDVGAGTGAASLPLRPTELIAVDESAAMLAELSQRAAALEVPVRAIEGRWPDVAGDVPVADVAVCAHVVFNVPDLVEFFTALTAHARRRVVVELPERHPTSWLNPLWEHFHGLRRPTTPTADDAAAIARELGYGVNVERHLAPEPRYSSIEEMAASACRRLCLDPARAGEVAQAARDLGVWPPDRTRWVTMWWDVPA